MKNTFTRIGMYSFYGILLQISLCNVLLAITPGNAQKAVSTKEIYLNLELDHDKLLSVFHKIEQLTDFNFVYNSQDIDRRMTLKNNYRNTSLYDILIDISRDTKLGFKRVNTNINVRKLQKDQPATVTEEVTAINVSGTVTAQADGVGLPGVNVLVKGSSTGTVTDVNGQYSLNVPNENDTLVFSSIGFTPQEIPVNGRAVIDVALAEDVQSLEEIVVTGYTTQQKKDITGAVAVIDTKDMLSVPAASFTQQLEGRASGIMVGTSGQPGAGASVRIRGIGSFNNNDPLYVIDGVPVTGTFQNYLNPNDIESMQVLKDASAASIYGARANNGVIIITTKKGKAGPAKITYDGYYGLQRNASPLINMLNPTQYADHIFQIYNNAGQTFPSNLWGNGPRPRLPDYVVPAGAMEGDPFTDPSHYTNDIDHPEHGKTLFVITKANKEGTDWQDEIFQVAPIQNHNLNISGGSDKNTYNVGMSYFNQEGIVSHTYFERFTLRANSHFNVRENIRIGENFQFSFINQVGALNQSSGGPIRRAITHHTIVPVYDIMGGFSSNKAPNFGTGVSPVAQLWYNKDDLERNIQMLGNVFAEVDFLNHFTARTSFGLNYGNGWDRNYTWRQYESSEPNTSNSYSERANYNTNWVWSNTLTYKKTFSKQHDVSVLAGTEAIKNEGRSISGSRTSYFVDDVLYRSLDRGETSQQNSGNGFSSSLFSVFGRVDYAFADKYLLGVTVRRDGSSRVGYNNPYGTFPAFSLGWRLSEESFMQGMDWIDDLKLRFGWGRTGNQNIDPANSYSSFGGSLGGTAYAIDGSHNSTTPGFAVSRYGNPNALWESQTSTNLGLDISLFKGKLYFTVDAYERVTEDLLYQLPYPATAGIAQVPFVNVGAMKNTGIEFSGNYRGIIGNDWKFDMGLNFTHYKNEITRVGESDEAFFTGGSSGFGVIARSQVGYPMASFYGFVVDGIFQSAEEVQAAADQPGISKEYPDPFVDYETPEGEPIRGFGIGRFRFKDINGDGVINTDDQDIIGNPHPDLIFGLNLNIAYRAFDLSAFFQGTYGNDLFFFNRWYTDFNTFQFNRSEEMLYESWRPDRTDARLPLLDVRDAFANGVPTSYYVQDGSYLRAKSIVLGYTLPGAWLNRMGIDNTRFYVQALNLFTLTKYEGWTQRWRRQTLQLLIMAFQRLTGPLVSILVITRSPRVSYSESTLPFKGVTHVVNYSNLNRIVMQNIINKSVLLVSVSVIPVALLISCGDEFLSQPPQGALDENTLTNEKGIYATLIGAYSVLDGWANDGSFGDAWQSSGTNWIWGSILGGEAYKGSTLGDQAEIEPIERYEGLPTNQYYQGKWGNVYNGVARANSVLSLLAKTKGLPEEKAELFTAEARFLRGHYHFELKKVFNNIPYVDEAASEVDFRVTNNVAIWPMIEADLQFAADHLPEVMPAVGRVNQWAAKAMLAKAYIFQDKYDQALPLLNEIIANGNTSDGKSYGLMDCFHDNFNAETKNNKEAVFSIQYSVNDGTNGANGGFGDTPNYPWTQGPGGCCGFFQPSQNLVNSYKTDGQGLPLIDTFNESDVKNDEKIPGTEPFEPYEGNLDPRLDWTVGRRGIPYLDWGPMPGEGWVADKEYGGPYVPKKHVYYESQEGTLSTASGWAKGPNSNNYEIIRFSDVILWAAEAEIEVGTLEKAREHVNTIRARAKNGCYVTNEEDTPAANYVIGLYEQPWTDPAAARKAVQFERKLELAMEGHRFFDLVRWGIAAETLNEYLRVEQTKRQHLQGATFQKGVDEYQPIPFEEIVNSSVDGKPTLTQNPGY